MAHYRTGIDIGGTFTDFSIFNEHTGEIVDYKSPSTPKFPANAIVNGLTALIEDGTLSPTEINYFVHGATIAINTVIQRKGAKLALFTTEGFGDILEIQRLRLPCVFDLYGTRTKPLIPRYQVMPIKERILSDGSVDILLDNDSVIRAIEQSVSQEVDGIVVCLINAYRNNQHELRIRDIIMEQAPNLFVFLSTEVWPEVREYERAMVAVINGYVHPEVKGYLDSLEKIIRDLGVKVTPYITKSNGGITTARRARTACAATLLSGPASGVMGATFVAKMSGFQDLITLDMGGTSADIALVKGGQPLYSKEEHVGDFPVVIPVVGVSAIGAGGGSIARLDSSGVLKVGPESAGADPGPSCYNMGGNRPTLTDAFLLCRFLNPCNFLGGRMKLCPELAEKAIGNLGNNLNLDVQEAAEAIVEVATANMYTEFSNVLSKNGVDPRDFTLIAFGGAGPVEACFLAREFKISRVLIPMSPGTLGALGTLTADVKSDYIKTVTLNFVDTNADELKKHFDELKEQATIWLAEEGPLVKSTTIQLSVDMRYIGQAFEVEVPIEEAWLTTDKLSEVVKSFHWHHNRMFGQCDEDAPTEIVNIRVVISGITPKPTLKEIPKAVDEAKSTGSRIVHYDRNSYTARVYDRKNLRWGHTLKGPAIVEQIDTTVLILDGFGGNVDNYGNIIIERNGGY